MAASWYKSNVMDVLNESIATGGDPNVSDAYTINGEPGDLYNCSAGIKSKQSNDSIIFLPGLSMLLSLHILKHGTNLR